jgi:hypothetical protein
MPAVSLICPHCEKPVEIQVAGVTRSRPCPECGETLMLQMAEKNTKARRRALLMGGAVPEVPKDRPLNLPTDQKPKSKAKIADSAVPPPPAAKIQPPAPAQPAEKAPPAEEKPAAAPAVPAENALAPQEEEPNEPPTGSMARSLSFSPAHEPQVLPGDAFDRMRMDPEIREFRKRLIIGSVIVLVCVIIVVLVNQFSGGSSPVKKAASAAETAPAASTLVNDEPPPPVVPEGSLVFKPIGQSDYTTTTGSMPPASTAKPTNSLEVGLSIEALRKFLAAPTWQERKAWCRPFSDLEEQMKAFYADHADGPQLVENIVEDQSAEGGYYEHVVVLEGGGRRTAHVQITSNGPRVDWAAFVGASEISWAQLMDKRPAAPVLLRVMVGDAFYYEHQFGNPGLLKCLKLTSAADPSATAIHAYCDRSTELAQKLEFWQRQHGKDATFPLTVRVKYPLNSASPTQVWLTDIVAEGWLLP